MRYILLLFCFYSHADSWETNQVFYLMNLNIPCIALTTQKLHCVEHVANAYNSVQIGDYRGTNPAACSTFVTDGVCGGSVQNCEWGKFSLQVTNDAALFITCRPITNGVTYIATNYHSGTPVVLFSALDQVWKTANLTSGQIGAQLVTLADSSTGWAGVITCDYVPGLGDSQSPVFTRNGDFIGSMSYAGGGGSVISFLYPSDAIYRPVAFGANGLSALFNSDPDR